MRRVKAAIDTRFLNFFPDNPLWMIPFECIEAYDVFFTKERYALRSLQQAGPPEPPLPADVLRARPASSRDADRRGACALRAPLSFVGSRYPYRERFMRELRDYPLRLWGGGWTRARDPEVRAMVAGGPVWGREKLCVYSGSTLSLNHHHPMNDIVGVNTRAFELAAAGACQVVDLKEDLATLFKPGRGTGRVPRPRRAASPARLLPRPPRRGAALGANARRRALAEHTLRHRVEEIVAAVDERDGPA